MELLFSKVIPLFLYPLGLALLLGFVVCLVLLFRRRWGSGIALLVIVGQLWLASMPVFSNWLIGTLERRYPEQAVESIASADAIVVLGGLLEAAAPPRLQPDLTDAADRLVHTYRLYHAGKAPLIVVSGGMLPWGAQGIAEAESIRALLVAWGVDEQAILVETRSRNTFENAHNTAQLLNNKGIDRILLVTSAFHMPRAVRVFNKAGVDLIAVSTDVRAVLITTLTLLDLLPDTVALHQTTLALKEYLGTIYYWWKGWM